MVELKNTTKQLVEDLIDRDPSYLQYYPSIFLEENDLSSEQIQIIDEIRFKLSKN